MPDLIAQREIRGRPLVYWFTSILLCDIDKDMPRKNRIDAPVDSVGIDMSIFIRVGAVPISENMLRDIDAANLVQIGGGRMLD